MQSIVRYVGLVASGKPGVSSKTMSRDDLKLHDVIIGCVKESDQSLSMKAVEALVEMVSWLLNQLMMILP